MAFDASPLSTVGDSFNPAGAVQQAYTLKGLADENQLNQLRLNQAKSGEADTAKAKQILAKSDISTPEGLMKASQALVQAGLPNQGMDLLKEGQNAKLNQQQFNEGQLRILQLSSDVIGPAALQIKQTMQTQGLPMAQAQYTQLLAQILPQIPPEIRTRFPAQPPQDPQQFMQLLDGAINGSQQARQIIASQNASRKEETAERTEAERERHDRAMEAKGTGTQKKAPTGFEWDPDNPDELRPIKGGPKDPNSKPWSGREKVFSERIVTSANEAVRAIKNITELPVGASSGVMGVGATPGHDLMASAKGSLANKLSSQDTQDYNTMLAGVRRNLATIESVGLAPSGALTEGFASLELRSGDTQLTKLRKLAEMRQIVDAGLEVQLADPAIPDSIKAVMHKVMDMVQGAVPYTQSDVTTLERAQQKNPDLTLGDLINQKGLRGQPTKITSDADYNALPSGATFIAPDGSTRRKP